MTAFELLRTKIKELRKIHENSVIDGTARDFSEYSHHVGIIQGMNLCLRELGEIEKLLEKGE
jgi:hypothetical protein